MDWIFVGFPPADGTETHAYVKTQNGFQRRCDGSIVKTEEDVCQLSEEEIDKMLNGDEAVFCPECIQFKTQLAP